MPPHVNRRRGRPPCCPRELAVHIIQLRCRGLSYAEISDVLNREQVQTPMGGKRWLKSHVDRLLHTQYVQDLIDQMSQTRGARLLDLTCALSAGSGLKSLARHLARAYLAAHP